MNHRALDKLWTFTYLECQPLIYSNTVFAMLTAGNNPGNNHQSKWPVVSVKSSDIDKITKSDALSEDP